MPWRGQLRSPTSLEQSSAGALCCRLVPVTSPDVFACLANFRAEAEGEGSLRGQPQEPGSPRCPRGPSRTAREAPAAGWGSPEALGSAASPGGASGLGPAARRGLGALPPCPDTGAPGGRRRLQRAPGRGCGSSGLGLRQGPPGPSPGPNPGPNPGPLRDPAARLGAMSGAAGEQPAPGRWQWGGGPSAPL